MEEAPAPSEQEALSEVVFKQAEMGWNPQYPSTKWGFKIFAGVADLLKRHEDKVKLRLYCSIGTLLDFHFKVDGFFMIDSYWVGIDLATWNKDLLPGKVRSDIVLFSRKDCLHSRVHVPCKKVADLFNDRAKEIIS